MVEKELFLWLHFNALVLFCVSVLRKRLAAIFSACVLSKKCRPNCTHRNKKVTCTFLLLLFFFFWEREVPFITSPVKISSGLFRFVFMLRYASKLQAPAWYLQYRHESCIDLCISARKRIRVFPKMSNYSFKKNPNETYTHSFLQLHILIFFSFCRCLLFLFLFSYIFFSHFISF